jgi:hypothetical protein
MKKYIFQFIFLISTTICYSQSKLGDVATVYITTSNLDSSVALYEKLGFSKIGSNTYPVPWAQVSDGSLLITMRKDDTRYIGLTYYAADVDKIAADLEKEGITFNQKPKEGDPLKRYRFKSPDGFDIVISNNLGGFEQPKGITMINMKPADFNSADKYPNKQCGVFGEFAQPVKDLARSLEFWKKLGFKSNAEMKEPYPHSILSDGLMIIGLHQTDHFNYPAITYFGLNTEKRVQQLKEKGLTAFDEMQGKNNVVLKTWEGQHFFIFSLGM